jgi:hypothetical protein
VQDNNENSTEDSGLDDGLDPAMPCRKSFIGEDTIVIEDIYLFSQKKRGYFNLSYTSMHALS